MTKLKPKGPGRPKKVLTPEQVEQVEKLAAILTQEQIADFLGIGERTLRQRIADDPEISASYARGRARAIGSVGTNLLQQAKDGNVRAMEFYLKTQAGWKESQRVEHSGDVYNFNPHDFSRDGLKRVAAGESPQHVLATGGGRDG